MKYYKPNLIPRSGRWFDTKESGSITASWSNASVSFFFSGSKLSFCAGKQTERKDKDNGGTQMLAIITGPTEEIALKNVEKWRTVDPEADSEIVIFDETDGTLHERTFVEIVLIDWASTFELSALITDDNGQIDFEPADTGNKLAFKRILVIGDSISSVMAIPAEMGGEPVPHGILDGYAFVAQRWLMERQTKRVKIELVAYPGMTLVVPTEEEKEKGQPSGMAEAFFWTSPWSKEEFTPDLNVDAVLLALGTNDQCFGIAPERFGDSLATFIAKLNVISNHSIRHVWVVPPFPDADTDNYELKEATPSFVPLLEERFAGSGTVKFKICDLVKGLTSADTVDGVHPFLKVHGRIGEELGRFIEEENL